MQNEGNMIFVGMKISDKLRDELDATKESMKPFFNDNNSRYLQIRYIDSDEYIGKVIDSGVSFEILNNLRMNLKTMLNMICPKFVFADSAITIMALANVPAKAFY